MRNQYPGTCFRCQARVEAEAGHFERWGSGWRVQHAECAIAYRGDRQATGPRPVWTGYKPGQRRTTVCKGCTNQFITRDERQHCHACCESRKPAPTPKTRANAQVQRWMNHELRRFKFTHVEAIGNTIQVSDAVHGKTLTVDGDAAFTALVAETLARQRPDVLYRVYECAEPESFLEPAL